jgi:hypothetical protein
MHFLTQHRKYNVNLDRKIIKPYVIFFKIFSWLKYKKGNSPKLYINKFQQEYTYKESKYKHVYDSILSTHLYQALSSQENTDFSLIRLRNTVIPKLDIGSFNHGCATKGYEF